MAKPADDVDDIDEFDDFGMDDFDDSALQQLDQIENKLINQVGNPSFTTTSASDANRPIAQGKATARFQTSSSYVGASNATASTSAKPLQRVASASSTGLSQSASSGAHRQMTLFGKPAAPTQPRAAKVVSSSPGHITLSSQSATQANVDGARFGTLEAKDTSSSARPPWQQKIGTKTWDREAYLHRENARNRDNAAIDLDASDEDDSPSGKGKQKRNWDVHSKYENVLPPPPPPRHVAPPQPQKCKIDLEAAKTWIYPTNMERRDYQYNIVQKALFNNVLVALPTGLGKTFIAAVVILNFFRWFPDGKIVFLAPTKPLVDQQKTACHRICGLPWDCAIDLTGNTNSERRADYWRTKRIFYMTPQTIENDILHNRFDRRDIVCVVVDEAHRARGRYAYGNVIGQIMEVNPHFRVLALSATPGKDSDSVQEVVDQLHINQIEIRTEEAIDVQRYMFRKREEIVNVPLGKDLNQVKDSWAKLMQTQMDPLLKAGLLHNQDPVFLHPFAVNKINGDQSRAAILKSKPFLRANISELAHMALSMQYLMEQSPTMFYNRLKERSLGYNAKGKKTSTSKQQTYANTNSTFNEIMRELEIMQDTKGRILHPKMLKLVEVLGEHFKRCQEERMHNAEAYTESGHNVYGCTPKSSDLSQLNNLSQADTRVMVFCSYRECCDEIVSFLNDSGFKATEFVGQSKAKNGKKGMSQKDQERVINDFKAGKYNVLVATSIGEEGLDIGSVDLTACYEAVKDSIRMLQRIGRTGRKREGKIVVLVSEGREQHNWQHSKENYKLVQNQVDSRLYVELFDDVDRMVPDHIAPRPILKEVEQPEFDPSMVSSGVKANAKPARAKKEPKPKKDPKRNMPEGGDLIAGFRKASTLAKRKQRSSDIDESGRSDADDPPINETHSQRMLRLLTMPDEEMEAEFAKRHASLDLDIRPVKERRRAAMAKAFSPLSSPEMAPRVLSRSSRVTSNSESRPDTPPLPDGIETPPLPSALSMSSSSRPLAAGRKLGVGLRRSSGRSATSTGTLALRKSSDALDLTGDEPSASTKRNVISPRSRGIATTVISDDDDDEFGGDDLALDMSMENVLARVEAEAAAKVRAAKVPAVASPAPTKVTRLKTDPTMVALMAEDEAQEQIESADTASGSRKRKKADTASNGQPTPAKRHESPGKSSMGPPDSAPRRAGAGRGKRVILESPDGEQSGVSSKKSEEREAEPDTTLSSPIKAPVRRAGRLQKATSVQKSPVAEGADTSPTARKGKARFVRGMVDDDDDDSSKKHEGPSRAKSQSRDTSRGQEKGEEGKKVKGEKRKKRKIMNSPRSRALFQYEAERSTDEEEHGERDEDDSGLGTSDEDDSDREAVGDFEPTQAPRGYHQQSVYMQSMLSQHAPPEFERLRHGPFPGSEADSASPSHPNAREGSMYPRRKQDPSTADPWIHPTGTRRIRSW